jgi:hypothetical protein
MAKDACQVAGSQDEGTLGKYVEDEDAARGENGRRNTCTICRTGH